MCISFYASILAGVIGEVSGAVAIAHGHVDMGVWIGTYSLIQFLEAWVYAGESEKTVKMLKHFCTFKDVSSSVC